LKQAILDSLKEEEQHKQDKKAKELADQIDHSNYWRSAIISKKMLIFLFPNQSIFHHNSWRK